MDNGNLIPGEHASGTNVKTHEQRRDVLRLCFFLSFLIVMAVGCALPKAPGDYTWDTHLTVPLGVQTYSLDDLVDPLDSLAARGSGIGRGDDSILYYTAITRLSLSIDSSLFFEALTDTLIKPADMQDTTDWFPLEYQQHRVYFGRISSGTVWLRVRNFDPVLDDTARVLLPNMINLYGDSLLVKVFVPALATVDTQINLATHRLRLEDLTPQMVEARLYSSQPVLLTAVVQTSRIYFAYFDGVFRDLELDSVHNGIMADSPPEGWESVHPARLDMYVHVSHNLHYPVEADADVTWRIFADQRLLDADRMRFPDVYLGADTTLVVEGLSEWSDEYPDSISTGTHLKLNGRVRDSTHYAIPLTVELRAPLAFTMDTTCVPGEITRIDNSDLKETQSGTVRIRIWNRLPVGGQVFLVADPDSASVLANSGATVDTIVRADIPLPPMANGRATSDIYTELTIDLTPSFLDLLRHPPFFTRTDITLPGSDEDTLFAHAADYVKVQIIADLVYRIDTGGDE
ncbi:hypothetical protein KKH27_13420 [bacterium]|nr:hypothetical protein [bacterium]MBU1984617.1 hypothetical protein [bacterium]